MKPEEVTEMLQSVDAMMNGHFTLSSGRHSDVYFEKFRALERPPVATALGVALADRFREQMIDVVLAPAVGAVVIGFTTALALGCRSIFAERVDGEMTLRRGFEIGEGERVLVVEDVVTTGKSLKEVIALVPPEQLAGIGCIVDRSGGATFPKPLQSLATLAATSWAPDQCPLCRDGSEAVSPGSRFIAR